MKQEKLKIILLGFHVLKITLQALVDIIFPYFCINCGKKNTLLCDRCYEQIEFISFPFSNLKQMKYANDVIIACKYHGVIKKLIHELKYKSVIDVGKIIARLIYRSSNILDCDLLIPVPMHRSKKRIRGFNQAEEIAKELSKLTNIPTANILIKSRKTRSQMSISDKNKRKGNLKDSFAINWPIYNKNKINKKLKTIMLIDDVITTGSTLDACAKILKNNGVEKIFGLVLAQR